VRQATQRAKQPAVLTNAEITALLSELGGPDRCIRCARNRAARFRTARFAVGRH
jgi:hypothetical protein